MDISRICILGGTGFVGRHLAARLVDAAYSVKVLTRNREQHRELLVLPTLDLVEANVYDPDTLRHEFAGCDAVINLIGILNERGHKGKGFETAHVEMARKAVTACRQAGVPRLLQMSALNADPRAPSHYLRTKGLAEQYIREHAGETLHWTIFQPSVIFGPGDSFINRFAELLKFTPVLPLACPRSRFAPAYVKNVVEAFARCLPDHHTWGRTYQLCGPKVYTLREIVDFILTITARRRLVIGLPDALARLQARVFEYFPGKPFSVDNYLSLQLDSVCTENGFVALDIVPAGMEAMAPRYLTGYTPRSRLADYRKEY